MADSLPWIAANLRYIRDEMAGYAKPYVLAFEEANQDNNFDSEISDNKTNIAAALASMMLIKACAFKDELDNHYIKFHPNTVTDKIRQCIDHLELLFVDGNIKKLRNSILAHNNRVKVTNTKYRMIEPDEIQDAIPFREPIKYNDLVERCSNVVDAIYALHEANQLMP
jgi:hypothetical protein